MESLKLTKNTIQKMDEETYKVFCGDNEIDINDLVKEYNNA